MPGRTCGHLVVGGFGADGCTEAATRWQRMLRQHVPSWTWHEPKGGLSLWIDLGGYNALDFAAFTSRHGVAVAPGTLSSPTSAYADHLRLPFGKPISLIETGVERLAGAWQEYTRRLGPADQVSAVL